MSLGAASIDLYKKFLSANKSQTPETFNKYICVKRWERFYVAKKSKRLQLGEGVLAIKLTPRRAAGKTQYFYIDWTSLRSETIIEMRVTAVQGEDGSWKAVEIELPEDTPKKDIADIAGCRWYVLDKESEKRCPPIIQAWEFDEPPVYILACLFYKSGKDACKLKPFKSQLDAMRSEDTPPPPMPAL